MPSASDDLRAQMQTRFGDAVSEVGPSDFLEAAGYTLARDWTWSKTGVASLDQMTREEFDCLMFLAHEWDYGGLTPA